MAGITRYHIVDTVNGSGIWRFNWSTLRQPQADAIYRMVCDRMSMPLEGEQTEHIEVNKSEFEAGYDRYLGIDVHLRARRGQSLTLQEKFLQEDFHHVTVEYYQDHKRQIRGDWWNLKAQLYFVGYDRRNRGEFDEWMLLDWPRFQMSFERYNIPFKVKENHRDGARASMATIHFDSVPDECVFAVQRAGRAIQLNQRSWSQARFNLDEAAD